VHTYIIGEHGDSEVAAWSTTSVAGMSIEEFCQSSEMCDTNTICTNHFYETVKNSAYEIIEKKGASFCIMLASEKTRWSALYK
jgi:L-lactate dehydrogenase